MLAIHYHGVLPETYAPHVLDSLERVKNPLLETLLSGDSVLCLPRYIAGYLHVQITTSRHLAQRRSQV